MSEPTDQNPSDPDPYDPMDDKDLSALYARGSTEQPSSAVDQAILNKARQATKTRDYSSWSQAFSVAAVLVLSVTLVTLVREEAPEPISDTSVSTLASLKAQKDAQPGRTTADTESKPISLMDSPAQNIEKNEEVKKEIGRVATKEKSEGILAERKKQETGTTKLQRQRREEEHDEDSKLAASPALSLQQKAPAPEAIAPKRFLAESLSPKTLSSKSMASGLISPGETVSELEGKSCNQLTEQECFTSAACTLTRDETANSYQCRPARDHCELLFRQSDGTKETCEAKTGCVFVPASCYCPPNVFCVCGGGEPAQCQSRER